MTTYRPVQTSAHYELVSAIDAEVGIYGTDLSQAARVVLVYPIGGGEFHTVDFVREENGGDRGGSSPQSIPDSGASIASAKQSVMARIMGSVTAGIRSFNSAIKSSIKSDEPFQPGSDARWRISPWSNSGDMSGTYVTDYVSGLATIRVLNGSGGILASQQIRIIKFSPSEIEFVSPKGMDMKAVATQGWDREFEPQVFPLEPGRATVRPIIAWN